MISYMAGNREIFVPNVKEAFEIEELIKIAEFHPVAGVAGAITGCIFSKVIDDCEGSTWLACSELYTIGKIMGIRQERARRKARAAV